MNAYLTNFTFPSSSSVGSAHTGQLSLPTCISELWLLMTQYLVHRCSFFGPLLIDTDHCRPETAHKSCRRSDQSSSHHSLVLVELTKNPHVTLFSCF